MQTVPTHVFTIRHCWLRHKCVLSSKTFFYFILLSCLLPFTPHPSHKHLTKNPLNKIIIAAPNSTLFTLNTAMKNSLQLLLISAIIFYIRAGEQCFPTFRCQFWQGLYWCLSFHHNNRQLTFICLLLFFV